jgi:hypothetical protein
VGVDLAVAGNSFNAPKLITFFIPQQNVREGVFEPDGNPRSREPLRCLKGDSLTVRIVNVENREFGQEVLRVNVNGLTY